MPSTTGKENGKKTGQRVTHYIIQHGKFETFCLHFLKGKSIKLSSFPLPVSESKSKNKVTYQCPSCELKVWGKPDIKIICGECEEELQES